MSSAKFSLRWVALAASLLGMGLGCLFLFQLDFEALHAWAGGLNGSAAFLLLSVLPLLGFPVSVLYMMAGAKFGFGTGLLLTSASIALNLLAMHWLASRFLRRALHRLLERTKYRLPTAPDGKHASLALLTALLPGPYAMKNYLLAIGGVPLAPYLAVCLPIYVFRASSAILFGGLSDGISFVKVLCFLGYGLVIAGVCRSIVKRWKISARATGV